MPDSEIKLPPDAEPEPQPAAETDESFGDLLSRYEREHARKTDDATRQLGGTVISVRGDTVFLDIGYKIEGTLPLTAFGEEEVKPGDKFPVSIKGRDPESGYYELSRTKVRLPTDWTALERAFNDKATIMGTVTATVKGGLSVDVGVRAFMPASRSGARDAAEMEKMIGQEIRCRILKLDVADEDIVVDRRAVLEEEERATKQRRIEEIREGDTVRGTVRSLADYGAFVDLGGVDGLLHVGEISWARVNKPEDALTIGQEVEARVLRVEPERRRISLSLRALQPQPWEAVPEKYKSGDRVRGAVTRLMEFGAFVELEPGIEGLIHVSEMSWVKRVKRPSDLLKPGDTVEAIILGINPAERRIALGLKQALGDPWADAARRFPVGSAVTGTVTSITNFGAFVQVEEGVEGMIHVSEISAEKRIAHPRDVLKVGQTVQAQVLAVDSERRSLRLSMKQLVPTGLDEYLQEHQVGDVVSGRLFDIGDGSARVELGEGIQAACRLGAQGAEKAEARGETKADLSSLGAMLQARWKGSAAAAAAKPEPVREGQIRSFRITRLDRAAKKIEVELA
jgi:small subunit ribosomal protein S1